MSVAGDVIFSRYAGCRGGADVGRHDCADCPGDMRNDSGDRPADGRIGGGDDAADSRCRADLFRVAQAGADQIYPFCALASPVTYFSTFVSAPAWLATYFGRICAADPKLVFLGRSVGCFPMLGASGALDRQHTNPGTQLCNAPVR